MSGPRKSLRDQFSELKEKVEQIRSAKDHYLGELKAKKAERDTALTSFKNLGLKKPESAKQRKAFIDKKKREIQSTITKKMEEADDALARFDRSDP